MEILINNLQDKLEVEKKLERLIRKVVKKVLLEKNERNKEVSIALVDNKYIQELNHRYRDQNKATDVLSFPQEDELLLGDIIISLERAAQQATEYNHSLQREVGFLTVHGMLHLLGYNHYQAAEKKIMRTKEEEILAGLGLTRE
ncbi:rRNA maturation RNase YbeY [Natroniella sulfidigena]|uniref:rRNA maturation RNase YbeY n=1 Tax=Natroniella sulfidigena TaxID=723921 RepID=UPI00200A57B2|nr:rRNA maturation RNase YbeY [Natroniella sulfidigena]MCK8815929.1 rRNA maturation RNase YbeY [Natroniella sulfidigena]